MNTCGQPVAAGLLTEAEGFGIVAPEPERATICPSFTDKATAPQRRPYRLSQADVGGAHAISWTSRQCSAFASRVVRMVAMGVHPTDADDLAERLHLRDIDLDTRRMCVECRHLRGHLANGPTCANHKGAGLGRELSSKMAVTLQRCGGFDAG